MRTLAFPWLLVACSGSPSGGPIDAPIVLVDAPLVFDAPIRIDAPLPLDAAIADAPDALVLGDSGGPPADAGPDGGPTVTLDIIFLGTGAGQVHVAETGDTCTSECLIHVAPGTHLTLSATAGVGSSFGGWGGGCSGSAGCAVTVSAATTVDATFTALAATVSLNLTTSGPGTVQLAPAGTSCGPGCTTYDRGTHVTLTPKPDSGFSFTAWSGGPCDAQAGACMLTLSADVSLSAAFCEFQHVVAPTGNDHHAGTCAAPFRTIGKGLSVAAADETVLAEAGTYDAAGGEIFPLAIPDGVRLFADETTESGFPAAEISGGGTTILLLGTNSTVQGMFIDQAGSAIGNCVVSSQGGAILSDVVSNCGTGIIVSGGAGLVLSGDILTGSQTGLSVAAAATGVSVAMSVFAGNQNGIMTLSNVDLGGGAAGSVGSNTIACNSGVDLTVTGAFQVSATNDAWNGGATPTKGCSAGNDVCLLGGATLVTTGATQAPACP